GAIACRQSCGWGSAPKCESPGRYGCGFARLSRIEVEMLPDRPLHVCDGRGRIDRCHELLALEDLDQRLGLLVVGGEADGERLGVVVVARGEPATAYIADILGRRSVRDQVVVEAALGAQPAGKDTPLHLRVGQVEV